MEEQRQNLYDLLSGFYTLLWAQLDSLFDEHRWVRRPPNEPATARTPKAILGELSKLERQGLKLPMSPDVMGRDADEIQKLVDDWRKLQGWLKKEPTNEGLINQAKDFRGRLQDKRALFEERALAFASLIAS